ncbi:hypothetical protein [Paenibacillus alba]|uniref:Uncharacterized protein n=1 Tax=Paenibacillus alba TaxID=1197127 RepID=A0ABU6G165_9BACL|nr:hypothetical protein [Paenibacillus alba]MEC0227914.1 hypothetical protein [Paenibacillus alba]NQX71674.1 hypothetical protein [Paenibacillus alba]
MEKRLLAYRIYPEPHGTNYEYSDLLRIEKIEEIFDYCQIGEAIISKEGWKLLIEEHGYQTLYEINEKSGWFECGNLEEFISEIEAQIDSS